MRKSKSKKYTSKKYTQKGGGNGDLIGVGVFGLFLLLAFAVVTIQIVRAAR
jgi:hypothetical protein